MVGRDRVYFFDHGRSLQIDRQEPVLPPSARAPIVAGVMTGIKRSGLSFNPSESAFYRWFLRRGETLMQKDLRLSFEIKEPIRDLVSRAYSQLFSRGFLVDHEIYDPQARALVSPLSAESLQSLLFKFNPFSEVTVFHLVAGSLDQRGLGLSDRLWTELFPSLDPAGAQNYIRN